MSEPEFDVEKAQAEYDAARASDAPPKPAGDGADDAPDDPALDPAAIDVDEIDTEKENLPPGFMSFEDYVAQGGDPDTYRGKKAFADEYERIQENKRLRGEIRGLKETVQQTMDTVQDWQSDQRQKIRTELEGELHTAKENEDVDGALATQKKIDKLDEKPDKPPQQQQEHPVIQGFREANPLLDETSDDFNAEFNVDVEAFYNETHARLSRDGKVRLTDSQISRALAKAMKDARELHVDLFESPRNKRPSRGGDGRQPRRGKQAEPAARAENFKIKDPRNPRQGDAASEVRDMIKDKYGDKHAKKFEESLFK